MQIVGDPNSNLPGDCTLRDVDPDLICESCEEPIKSGCEFVAEDETLCQKCAESKRMIDHYDADQRREDRNERKEMQKERINHE